VQPTEAEKNRQARTTSGHHPNSVPFHRLYVGNIHFSITETDLQHVFEPFGELEFVQLQKDENGRSRGYGFVQYVLLSPLPPSSFLLPFSPWVTMAWGADIILFQVSRCCERP